MSSVTTYAKQNGLPILVRVTGDGEPRSFKLMVNEYREKIKKYCAYFETEQVSKTYNDYEEIVRLKNGIEFKVCLY